MALERSRAMVIVHVGGARLLACKYDRVEPAQTHANKYLLLPTPKRDKKSNMPVSHGRIQKDTGLSMIL